MRHDNGHRKRGRIWIMTKQARDDQSSNVTRRVKIVTKSCGAYLPLILGFALHSSSQHSGTHVRAFTPQASCRITPHQAASAIYRERVLGMATLFSSPKSEPNASPESSKKNRSESKIEHKEKYNFWEEKLSIAAFNMDLHNLSMEDAAKAQDALEIMEDMYETEPDNPSVVRPDSASYTTVIEGWCYGNYSSPRACERAQALLERMVELPHLEPNDLTYILVCQKLAETNKKDPTGANIRKAQDILLSLKASNRQPSAKVYSIVLEGWCRRVGSVPKAMDRVEELLVEMENSEGKSRPNVLTYTSVIGGLARSRDRNLATRADNMLQRMRQHGVEPDMVAYTSVLNCWAKSTSREERAKAATRAMELLQEMEELYINEENYHTKPNAITYATAIRSIGNSLDPNAPALAEKILWHMYNVTEKGSIHVPPNAGTYNAVITSLSTSGSKSNRLANARRAEHLLVEMIKRSRKGELAVEPNVRTWGAVLRAWADSGQPDCGEQAQRVLDQLQQWYDEGKSRVKPNVVCYTTVMNAWGRGSAPLKVALSNVERMLRTMEETYEETLDPEICPNKITYVTAIDVFCRKCKEDAATRAQAVVDRMMKLYSKGVGFERPTRIVFNALINAWSRSNAPDAAENAEKIFRWMESQYQSGVDYLKPDVSTLCGVLNAWANNAENGGALRAQQILDHTESLSFAERGFENSIICYNILIKAWGRSRDPDSVKRAEEILIRLESGSKEGHDRPRPDITTYSSVINCCAYYAGNDEGRKEAINVAMRSFAKLKETGEGPNHITYGTLFKAIAKLTLLDEMREELVEKLFVQCCQEGQIDAFVLSQVRSASSIDLYRKLLLEPCRLQDHDKNDIDKILKAMPYDWGKNVLQ